MELLKLGVIGLDISHVETFARIFNCPGDPLHMPGVGRIVKAFPGGSESFSDSWTRVDRFTRIMRQCGTEIVERIADMADMDAFLLTSSDGDRHLRQFRELAPFGKPVFIGKPLACSFEDARKIIRLAEEYAVPVMTCSSIRYAAGVCGLCTGSSEISAAEAFGPMPLPEDYRDYFWYGIHSAELLYSYLGRGCISVQSIHSGDFDILIGCWQDGRQGIVCSNRTGAADFGIRLTTAQGHLTGLQDRRVSHIGELSRRLPEFLRNGISAIDSRESLEITAFLEAASRSLHDGGRTVYLSEFMEKCENTAGRKEKTGKC